MFGGLIDRILQSVEQGVIVFLGLLCCLIFAVNAVLLVYLIMRKSAHGLARCPRCGRMVACPHCREDEDHNEDG